MRKIDFINRCHLLREDMRAGVITPDSNDRARLIDIMESVKNYDDDAELAEYLLIRFEQVVDRLYRMNSEPVAQYAYAGRMTFQDFQKSGHLIKISGADRDQYLYFDPNFIDGFNKCKNDVLVRKFETLVQPQNIKISRKENDQGLKLFQPNIKCSIKVKKETVLKKFSGELKIKGETAGAARVLCVSLPSLNGGPEIFVATHLLEEGIHNKKHNKATFISKDLKLTAPDLRARALHANNSQTIFGQCALMENRSSGNSELSESISSSMPIYS